MRQFLLILSAVLMTAVTAWANSAPNYTFNSQTGKLDLISGDFNSSNKWGSDVAPDKVKSVTATSQVRFVGDCSELFYDFYNCTSMSLNAVNTSQMTSTHYMFHNCAVMTSLDISSWDTGNVTDMSCMFMCCAGLTSMDFSSWDMGKVTYMYDMFYYCSGLTSISFANCNISNVTYMEGTFMYCPSLTTIDLSGCNTGNVTSMYGLFYHCSNLTTVYVDDNWSTAKVTDSSFMFENCTSIEGDMGTTFDSQHTDKLYARIDGGPDCPGYLSAKLPRYTYDSTTGALTLNQGVFNKDDNWDDDVVPNAVTSVTASKRVIFSGDCSELFKGFSNCTSMDLSQVNTSNATSMYGMFENCSSLTSLDLSNWNTANVTDMSEMFMGCSALTSLDLSSWNTAKLNKMNYMFKSCAHLQSLKISSFNTTQVYTMYCMFEDCSSLVELDISGWYTPNSTQTLNMFKGCSKLKTIYAGGGWTVQYVISSSGMFDGCTSLKGGKGTTYNASHTDKEYARIDGGSDSPGYFSDPNVAPAVEVVVGSIKFNMIEVEGREDYDIPTFYIGECEVTEALWLAVMGGENPSSYCGNLEENLPVENISWNDCQEFITKLNAMTHLQFRLPNADEWLWAAAGGNRTQHFDYSGSNNIDEVAWYKNNCSRKQTVGTKMPNELGIHDMSGNVYEIVQEHTEVYGGGWHAPASSCLVGYSWGPTTETFTDNDTGFRLALTQFMMSGDVTGEGDVDVSDVNAVINIILHKKTEADYPGNADITGEGNIDVSDVNAIINIILHKN